MRFACPNRMPAVPSFFLAFSAVFMFALYYYSNAAAKWQNLSIVFTYQPYNLMEETFGENWAKEPADKYLAPSYCTIEYANTNQLQQDHPCVIRLIRESYLRQPAPKNVPYNMNHSETIDPSDGQSKEILRLLHNQTNGFFIECGGFDGEFLSNTLYMERSLDWSGLLIEADKKVFTQLISRNRKAFTSPACLSTKPFPMEVVYNGTAKTLGAIIEEKDVKQPQSQHKDTENIYKMQCFPLYSILLAIGRTDVDYFGLDVEGAEYKILKTIPWHKVNMKTVTAEWNHVTEGEPGLTRLMESNKFTKTGLISNYYTREVVYIQNSFNIYREK
ncbi:protein Star-like [Daphnia pulicaria]|uniref:protein Star-like n=1 Tax=Daphnia pulicaria TaxID=35523 RepID=UPI001EEA546D|nr:protein Star-like [Daphnia pulicaria]